MQIAELHSPPSRDKMESVRNAPLYRSGNLVDWLRRSYRWNKPFGGLWTSTKTPNDTYICDWQRGRLTNESVRVGLPLSYPEGLMVFELHPNPAARIREIVTFEEALEFTREFHVGTIPLPDSLRATPLGRVLSSELTDWQRVFWQIDGVHLTPEAADHVAWEALHSDKTTAFHTWNCESTLWGRWVFDAEVDQKRGV